MELAKKSLISPQLREDLGLNSTDKTVEDVFKHTLLDTQLKPVYDYTAPPLSQVDSDAMTVPLTSSDMQNNFYITPFFFAENSDSSVCVASYNNYFNTSSIYLTFPRQLKYSTDGCKTWTEIPTSTIPSGYIVALKFINNQFIVLFTNGTIYTSSDGASWTQQTKLTNATDMYCFDLEYAFDNYWVISIYYRNTVGTPVLYKGTTLSNLSATSIPTSSWNCSVSKGNATWFSKANGNLIINITSTNTEASNTYSGYCYTSNGSSWTMVTKVMPSGINENCTPLLGSIRYFNGYYYALYRYYADNKYHDKLVKSSTLGSNVTSWTEVFTKNNSSNNNESYSLYNWNADRLKLYTYNDTEHLFVCFFRIQYEILPDDTYIKSWYTDTNKLTAVYRYETEYSKLFVYKNRLCKIYSIQLSNDRYNSYDIGMGPIIESKVLNFYRVGDTCLGAKSVRGQYLGTQYAEIYIGFVPKILIISQVIPTGTSQPTNNIIYFNGGTNYLTTLDVSSTKPNTLTFDKVISLGDTKNTHMNADRTLYEYIAIG